MPSFGSWEDSPQLLEVHVNYQPTLEADLEESGNPLVKVLWKGYKY